MRLLRLRGVKDRAEARRFLSPELPEPTELLPNLPAAIERLARAVRDGERVAVYGDYDADGITATAVLVEGLTDLGGVAFPYIPDRFTEGYGLNEGALRGLIERGARVVVTVDTGTNAVAEIAYANERSLDVVVVDHHLPKATLPDAVAIVNPRLPGTPPSHENLSGCGVAYALLVALAGRLGRGFDPTRYLDLVAISTVCDMVPLLGANRALVAAGLRELAARPRPGIAAMLDAARLSGSRLTAHSLGFVIGPRLNAAGRLEHALTAYELLTTREEGVAHQRAQQLEALNQRRRQLTDEALLLGHTLVAAEGAGAPLIMVGDAGIHPGIAGLVAGRLAEAYHRPAIVYHRGETASTGSARGLPDFDIYEMLAGGAVLLERFGGHPQAAGFRVRNERLDDLRHTLTDRAAAERDWSVAAPELAVDLELPLGAPPSLETVLARIDELQPCGRENEPPLFLARGARVISARRMGKGDRHLRLLLGDAHGRPGRPAVAWGFGPHLPAGGAMLDLVYTVERDRDGRAELKVCDFLVTP